MPRRLASILSVLLLAVSARAQDNAAGDAVGESLLENAAVDDLDGPGGRWRARAVLVHVHLRCLVA